MRAPAGRMRQHSPHRAGVTLAYAEIPALIGGRSCCVVRSRSRYCSRVGGTRAAVNPRITAHGSVTKDTTIDVDSMKMNTLVGGGDSHPDHNDAMVQEMTVQTSSLGAEVSAGGPHINLIPRDGGNRLSGATYVGYSNSAMQFDNLTSELLAKGLATPDAVQMVYDVNTSVGGPLRKDTLWTFLSYRNVGNENIVANSFNPDGSPGIYDQKVKNYTARLTWQINPTNKFTIYDDYQTKYVGHLYSSGIDVATASRRRPPVIKYTGAAKWTSTFGNKLLVDAGYGTSVNSFTEKYQPGILKAPFTPEWYANAARVDITRGTTTTASTPQTGTYNFRYMLMSSASYVTGSHAIKTGVQWHIGQTWNTADSNADLVQRYRDGVPEFGLAPARHPDLGLKRAYDIEYTIAVDRQVLPGVATTVAWYKRDARNLEQQFNTLLTVADYAAFDTPSPLNGEAVTIYNLNRAKQGLSDLLDTTATDSSKAASVYTGFEVSFSARLPKGGNLFGGWSTDRTVAVTCAGNDPNTFRYCDQTALDIPFRHDFKFNGSYPLIQGTNQRTKDGRGTTHGPRTKIQEQRTARYIDFEEHVSALVSARVALRIERL